MENRKKNVKVVGKQTEKWKGEREKARKMAEKTERKMKRLWQKEKDRKVTGKQKEKGKGCDKER